MTEKVCLDVGCNSGYFLFKLKEKKAAWSTGIDLGEKFIPMKSKLSSYHEDNFDFIGLNCYLMPELAARGLLMIQQFYDFQGKPKHNEDLEIPYPDFQPNIIEFEEGMELVGLVIDAFRPLGGSRPKRVRKS